MARTGGDRTRARILSVAEKLFSQGGFDATSVDRIARAARVNKALIYYHFENKGDLVLKLFESIIEELEAHVESRSGAGVPDGEAATKRKVREEIEFLAGRKRILSLMLAEALRSNECDDFLFRCAEIVARKEHGGKLARRRGARRGGPAERRMVHEFFTGFVPLVAFVTLRDKWCEYFQYDPDRIADDFVEAFARSHLASQG